MEVYINNQFICLKNSTAVIFYIRECRVLLEFFSVLPKDATDIHGFLTLYMGKIHFLLQNL